IRDRNVTGVQTCALPIWRTAAGDAGGWRAAICVPAVRCRLAGEAAGVGKELWRMKQFLRFVVEWKTATALSYTAAVVIYTVISRSEERRVGKGSQGRRSG